jgi:hypothetical protein
MRYAGSKVPRLDIVGTRPRGRTFAQSEGGSGFKNRATRARRGFRCGLNGSRLSGRLVDTSRVRGRLGRSDALSRMLGGCGGSLSYVSTQPADGFTRDQLTLPHSLRGGRQRHLSIGERETGSCIINPRADDIVLRYTVTFLDHCYGYASRWMTGRFVVVRLGASDACQKAA